MADYCAICLRFSSGNSEHVIEGSTLTEFCEDCGERLYTSPATVVLVREMGRSEVRLICVECFSAQAADDINLITTRQQIQELLAHKSKPPGKVQ